MILGQTVIEIYVCLTLYERRRRCTPVISHQGKNALHKNTKLGILFHQAIARNGDGSHLRSTGEGIVPTPNYKLFRSISNLFWDFTKKKSLSTRIWQGHHQNGDRAARRPHSVRAAFTHLELWRKLDDCSFHHFTTSQCILKICSIDIFSTSNRLAEIWKGDFSAPVWAYGYVWGWPIRQPAHVFLIAPHWHMWYVSYRFELF